MSCYFIALESDWGTVPNNCATITVNKVVYSGTVTNPNGLTGTYCSAFIEEVRLQGSAVLNSGQDIQYNATTGKIVKVTVIKGIDGTPVVAKKTVARDKGTKATSCTTTHYPIIPTTGVLVDVDQIGTGLSANDTGCSIAGYRLDYFKGAGKAVCSAFNNIISVSACNPGNANCPASAVH